MKKFVAVFAAVLFAILAIVPMSIASADSNRMYVTSNGSAVRLRSLPNDKSKIVTSFNVGRPVEVLGYNGDWAEIRVEVSGKYVYGYMMDKYLTANDPATADQHFKAVKKAFTVTARPASGHGIVSVWKTTNKHGHKLFDLRNGERVTVLAQSKAWYKVMDANGVIGFMAKAYAIK